MNKKGFTLIELLAVIIILGILMLIAIPSVTTYINNSRKSTYASTIKEIIKGTVVRVNNGDLDIFDTNTTYYIPTSAIKLESGKMQSPYGKIENDAYVVVTYNGESYDYYYIGKDEANVGIGEVTKSENISRDSIQSDLGTINTSVGIDGREYIVVFDENLSAGTAQLASRKVSGKGNTDSNLGSGGKICRKATTLHSSTCAGNRYGCYYGGNGLYQLQEEIVFGSLVESNTLVPGNAFDCDVNADGTYDPETERFYYIGQEGNNVNLIFYSNVYNGEVNKTAGTNYDNSGESWHGPRTAYEHLPSKDQWTNNQLIAPGTRQITNELGGTTVNNNSHEIEPFTYTDKVARLATFQEIYNISVIDDGYVDLEYSVYLVENTRYDSDTDTSPNRPDYYLETPDSDYPDVNVVSGYNAPTLANGGDVGQYSYTGVRPVITILLSNLEY